MFTQAVSFSAEDVPWISGAVIEILARAARSSSPLYFGLLIENADHSLDIAVQGTSIATAYQTPEEFLTFDPVPITAPAAGDPHVLKFVWDGVVMTVKIDGVDHAINTEAPFPGGAGRIEIFTRDSTVIDFINIRQPSSVDPEPSPDFWTGFIATAELV